MATVLERPAPPRVPLAALAVSNVNNQMQVCDIYN